MRLSFPLVATLAAWATALFGIGFLLVPEQLAALYGVSQWNPGTLMFPRLFGAAFLFMSVVLLAVRDCPDAATCQRVARSAGWINLLGVAVSVQATLSGATNALMWSSAAIYGFFVIAWLQAARPESTPR